MSESVPPHLQARLIEKLTDSLVQPIPAGTPRHVHGRMTFAGKATAIVGMRRAGKTTFLHQLRGDRLESGQARELLPFLNFEDEQLAGLEASSLHVLIDEYYRLHPQFRHQETVTLCLDEIQTVPGWERFVRRLLDEEKMEIVVTGSSAALLSREIATALRGRAWEVPLYPFSFEEALRHQGVTPPKPGARLASALRSTLERAFLDYLDHGGFPEAQGLDKASRFQLLGNYVDVAILRDVVERHQVTNVAGLRWMVRHLLGNAASLFSVEKFYAALRSQGIGISKDTIHQLLAHLEDCFLVRTVSLDTDSERKRMVNPRKAYPIDSGLIPIFDLTGRRNLGHALETAVLIELERRGSTVGYVKTAAGREVDFLARSPVGERQLIQVSADVSDQGTFEREVRALEEAAAEYPDAGRLLLTLDRRGIPGELPPGIEAKTTYEWMLEEPGHPPRTEV
jgi:uncharacterized protein